MQADPSIQAGHDAVRLCQNLENGYKLLQEYAFHNATVSHPLQKRMLSTQQINEFTFQIIERTAQKFPMTAVRFAKAMLPFLALDSRINQFLIYFGCALFWAKQNRNALVLWHLAAKSPPAPTESQDSLLPSSQTMGHDVMIRLFTNALLIPPVPHGLTPASKFPTAASLFQLVHQVQWKNPRKLPTDYHIFNPSIITHPADPSKFLVCLRAADYYIRQFPGESRPFYRTSKGQEHKVINTINYLTAFPESWTGDTFREKDVTPLRYDVKMPFPRPSIQGFEDVRLVWNSQDKTLWGSFTSLEMTKEQLQTLCVGRIDLDTGLFFPHTIRALAGPRGMAVSEKNWMPFEYAGQLYWVYACDPMVVVLTANLKEEKQKTNEATNAVANAVPLPTRVVSVDMCPLRNSWRGSSPLLRLSDAKVDRTPSLKAQHQPGDVWYLALVHVSAWPHYAEQFIVFRLRPNSHDTNRPFSLQILGVTPTFVFESFNIEFACGLAATQDESQLMLPYSLNDERCYLMRLGTDSVLDALKPIASPDAMVASKWVREEEANAVTLL